ncbi:hypothetical protein OHA37_36495 [Streptomyces sp. NBC_00335]|nr:MULTISPECIES: hypothetical protein [unclassified Streptomyces]MCX5409343.1 hypothetical protein [Streptomyces sp. NBC_00086]
MVTLAVAMVAQVWRPLLFSAMILRTHANLVVASDREAASRLG